MIYEKEKRYIIPFDDVPSPRTIMPEIEVDERRLNFTEVETGFSEADAKREAKRCLSCRRCLGCALCWAECKPEAIDFDIPDQELEIAFDEVLLTHGQDNAFQPINEALGFGRFADVMTDLQFERMLSPTGPTQGLVISPRDGEVPQRVALVQGDPKADDVASCASLVRGVNEAILALARTKGLEISLIAPPCGSFQEKFLADAKKVAGLQIIEGTAQETTREEDLGALQVQYSANGKSQTENFDLVVVLTQPEVTPALKTLAKKLEQDIM